MLTKDMIVLLIAGYLCGSIPFGKLIADRMGVDIQKRGSGNIGFANVRRVLGWQAGLLTLAGDIIKGIIPTYLAFRLGGETAAFAAGLAAIIGHLYPVWLEFRGGKGIATGLGVMLVLQPVAAAIGVAVYLVGCLLIRNSGLSSITGVVCLTAVAIIIEPDSWWQFVLLLLIACWTLRSNIAGKVPNYDI